MKEFVALNKLLRNFRLSRLLVGIAVVGLCYGCLTQSVVAQAPTPPFVPDPKLGGFNWGVGLAADFDVGGKRVNSATLANNNIVRATDTDRKSVV